MFCSNIAPSLSSGYHLFYKVAGALKYGKKMEYAVKGGTFDSVFYFEWSLSYSSIVPRREDSKRRTLTLNLQLASKLEWKAATYGFPMASSSPYVVEFGPIQFPTEALWSCQRFPTT